MIKIVIMMMKWLLLLLHIFNHQELCINIYYYGYKVNCYNTDNYKNENTITNNYNKSNTNTNYYYYFRNKSTHTLNSLYLSDISWLNYINEVYDINSSYLIRYRYNSYIDNLNLSYHENNNLYHHHHHHIQNPNISVLINTSNIKDSNTHLLLPIKSKWNFYYKNTIVKVLTIDWPTQSHLLFPTTPPAPNSIDLRYS